MSDCTKKLLKELREKPIVRVSRNSKTSESALIIHSHFGHHRLLIRSKAAGTESHQANDRNPPNDSPRPSESGQSSRSINAEMQLSRAEQQQVQELRVRDSAVRAHEQAHLAAAGKFATGGPSFEYRRGPDGRMYAIGGEVKIDTSPVSGDPQATLQKAQKVQKAALAPSEPSAQDRAVAVRAARMAAEARAELKEQQGDTESRSQSTAQNVSEHDIESRTAIKTDGDDTLSACTICGGKHGADAHLALKAYNSYQPNEAFTDIAGHIVRSA